jgi:ribosome-associated translation inhibitor RaiA
LDIPLNVALFIPDTTLRNLKQQKEGIMNIQINTDRHIKGQEAFLEKITNNLKNGLSRVSDHITRVEVHLSDDNAEKNGLNDKRCIMEARLEGRQPIAISCQAKNLDQAIDGAIEKLVKLIENKLERQHDKKRRDSNLSRREAKKS